METGTSSGRVRFGDFEVNLRSGELHKHGIKIKLHGQPFQILAILLEQPGEVITRDQLRQRLWPADTFVDFDVGLNSAVKKLRDALGDSAETPRYIETLTRRGYRFVGEVARGISPAGVASQRDSNGLRQAAVASARGNRRWGWTAAGAAVALSSLALLTFLLLRANEISKLAKFRFERITGLNDAFYGVLSNDGNYLAYVSIHEGQESLWMRPVASAGPGIQVVPAEHSHYWGVTFSPDGAYLYYVRAEGLSSLGVLYRVNALGGTPQRLIDGVDGAMSFEPGGKRMVYKKYLPGEKAALVVAHADGSEAKPIAESAVAFPYFCYQWDENGKIIYAEGIWESTRANWYVVEVSTEGGPGKRIIGPLSTPIRGIQRWSGTELAALLDDAESGIGQIWIYGPHGETRRVTNDANPYTSLFALPRTGRMLASQAEHEDTLWIAAADQEGIRSSAALRSQELRVPVGMYEQPAWTPEGNIVYTAASGGGSEDLWWMSADGKNQRQITSGAGHKRQARVSPDGRFVVYTSNRIGILTIWRIEIDGTNARQLTFGEVDYNPQISPSRKWVVYASRAAGRWGIWKVPSDGGQPSKIADSIDTAPVVSPDGRFLAFEHSNPAGKKNRWAILSFEDAALLKEVDLPENVASIAWSRDGRALVFIRWHDKGEQLWAKTIASGDLRMLGDLGVQDVVAIDWSSDGKKIVFLRRNHKIGLVLIQRLP